MNDRSINAVTYQDAFAQGVSLIQRCENCQLCEEHQHVCAAERALRERVVRENIGSMQTEAEISRERVQELIDIASAAALKAPEVDYGQVFNCVLNLLVQNEYRIPRNVEIIMSYEEKAGNEQTAV